MRTRPLSGGHLYARASVDWTPIETLGLKMPKLSPRTLGRDCCSDAVLLMT